MENNDFIQMAPDGKTVWVHAADGSTVGRFSKRFGMDIHRTVTEQMAGAGQCLHCTHEKPTQADWLEFCRQIEAHHGVMVDAGLLKFDKNP